MIETFKEQLPVSYEDLKKENVDLSVVICLFEKGVLLWCVLQKYVQSLLQNYPALDSDVEAVFLKILLADEQQSSRQVFLDLCNAVKERNSIQDKPNKKSFHFVLKFLIKNDFFTFDLKHTLEYEWWQFYELMLSLLAIFEPAENANELRMEYLILNELRFGSPNIILSAISELEFKDEFPIWESETSLFQRCLSKLKKLMRIN